MMPSSRPLSDAPARERHVTDARRARPRRLDVRLSTTDHARIAQDAARRGLTVSAYTRQALLGQIDHARDHDAQFVADLTQAVDARAEALAETIGEIALTLLERGTSEPIPEREQRTYIAGALRCFHDALRRRLTEGTR
jgi:hypothetical protein